MTKQRIEPNQGPRIQTGSINPAAWQSNQRTISNIRHSDLILVRGFVDSGLPRTRFGFREMRVCE